MTTSGTQLAIVGVDGSAESVTALKWAAHYAAGCKATLRAVMAWHYPSAAGLAPGVTPKQVDDEVRQRMSDALDKAIDAGAPNADVERQIGYGHPSQVLVDASDDADLLIVGSHGHGRFTGMLVGSVSSYCVAHAHCPVVVVRAPKGG